MNIIELAGRLKETVRLNGFDYQCKDVNLDKDFLINISKELVNEISNDSSETKLYYKKFFDEEIISRVKFIVEVDVQQYEIVLTRDTYGDKLIVGCHIEPKIEEFELFGTVYNLKIIIIEWFNKICENSNIFMLQDFNNELICQSAYSKIHKVENRLRNLITKYLMKKYGRLLLSKSLKNDVDDYSKWFRRETRGKYETFKRINTDYANLDFSKIVKILDLNDTKCINETGNSVSSEIASLDDLIRDDIDFEEVNKQISKIKEKISQRKNIFDDSINDAEDQKSIDLRMILDSDFRTLWENELSKMRNMVAHNKLICQELYNDICSKCDEVNRIFDEGFDFISGHFYADEEGVFSELEYIAMKQEEEQEHFHIEQAREQVGIGFSLCESTIESKITEDSSEVQNFISVISVLKDMSKYLETIYCLNEEFRIISDKGVTTDFKRDVFDTINDELSLGRAFDDVEDMELIDLVYELLYEKLDIDAAIAMYTEEAPYSSNSDSFEYLSWDYHICWFSSDNEKYEVDFYGLIEPENGSADTLHFDLLIDDEKNKTYSIRIDYGDYTVPSEGYIDDGEVADLISDIEEIINTTHSKYHQISRVADMLLSKCS